MFLLELTLWVYDMSCDINDLLTQAMSGVGAKTIHKFACNLSPFNFSSPLISSTHPSMDQDDSC